MKRKLLSLALALVMCLGLAVPAFAAEKSGKYELTITGPEGYEPEQVTAEYQVMECRFDGGKAIIEYASAPTDAGSISAWVLPRGTKFTISGVQVKNKNNLTDHSFSDLTEKIYIDAWSDPDGDGIYTDRTYRNGLTYDGPEVVPLTEERPFVDTEDCFYSTFLTPQELFFIRDGKIMEGTLEKDSSGQVSLSYSADMFYELYGPNTLLMVSLGQLVIENDHFADKRTFAFLLPGDAEPEPAEPEEPVPAVEFTDVPEDAYYAKPVAWAIGREITTGATPTSFEPTRTCNNAQIITFLWRAYGRPDPTIANPFTNPIQEPYEKAAVWAYEKGMVSGSTFDENIPCTRAMTVTYLWQAAGSPETAPSDKFTDVPADAPYAQAVAWAVEKKITSGATPTTFAPADTCERGQIVAFLYNALAEQG